MSEQPKVTVVTPTLNMGAQLEGCIESVRSQGYPHLEHIVLDACSVDGTVELLQASSVVWRSEPDSGQSNAINKGFSMASGSILTWLNADDRLAPGAVEAVVSAFEADPSLGWVYGDLEMVSEGKRWVHRPPGAVDERTLRRGNVLPQPGAFFTVAALEAAGGIDEDFNLTMDFELWLRFVATGVRSRYLPLVLATFFVHPASKTGSQGALAFAQEEALAFQKHGQPHRAAMVIDRWHWDDVVQRVLCLLEAGEYGAARNLAARELRETPLAIDRPRLFLQLVRVAPRLAKRVTPLKRSRPPT
ncbi:MAG: glycosyltransferase family 2 protein [Chloroflexota bacterium]